jgi:hypothetical protein
MKLELVLFCLPDPPLTEFPLELSSTESTIDLLVVFSQELQRPSLTH